MCRSSIAPALVTPGQRTIHGVRVLWWYSCVLAKGSGMPEFCSIDKRDHVFVVTLERPERLNALHPPGNAELGEVFDEFFALFPATMELSICAILFAVSIGIPIGIFNLGVAGNIRRVVCGERVGSIVRTERVATLTAPRAGG